VAGDGVHGDVRPSVPAARRVRHARVSAAAREDRSMTTFPVLRTVVLDATDARAVAEFWRQLLGFDYRPGDEVPPPDQPDVAGQDWLVLRDRTGETRLAVQQVDELPASTWPHAGVPQQLHLDLTVADVDELSTQLGRALSLGATLRLDRSEDPDEPLYVLADPAGHPFCIFVSPDTPR
jgi:catechol 2,3-dioxygenase-like lactoylglutathione lyase family enzyme